MPAVVDCPLDNRGCAAANLTAVFYCDPRDRSFHSRRADDPRPTATNAGGPFVAPSGMGLGRWPSHRGADSADRHLDFLSEVVAGLIPSSPVASL